MRKALLLTGLVALTTAPVFAQNSVLFVGRFPFVSLDEPNETAAGLGGSITELSEFAISAVTPGAGAVARSLIPATAHEAYIGDPLGTQNYTYLRGFKTYFQRINFAGPFVKHVDKTAAAFDPRKVFFTVRDQDGSLDFQFFDNNGTATVVINPGDFIRWDENGNLEYFVRQADFAVAQGPQTGSFADGASALCQDAAGNLYYSPAEGGHWVNGNPTAPIFAFDGSIVRIPRAAITYQNATAPFGNVVSFAPSSAELIFIETSGLSPTVREMVGNAGTVDRSGVQQTPPAVIANVVGLDLDPNGGVVQSAYVTNSGADGDMVPNMVFTADDGKWAGTIWSTAPVGGGGGILGSIATINGVQCGSTNTAVPADGSWLGVKLDMGNFQPTLMGLAVVGQLACRQDIVDVPDFGGIDQAATTLFLDFNVQPNAGVAIILTFGPIAPGQFVPSLDFGSAFGVCSFNTIFTLPNALLPTPLSFPIGVADPNGYAGFNVPNPNTGAFPTVIVFHGASLGGGGVQVSNPSLIQYK